MKSTTLLVMFGATLGLVACGGGGSDSTAPTPMVTPQNANAAPKPAIGGNITPNHKDNSVAKANTSSATTDNINRVVIDGKTIDFIPAGLSAQHINISANNMTRVGGSSVLSYTRFGYTKEGRSGQISTGTPTYSPKVN